jgi:hypothetical protein
MKTDIFLRLEQWIDKVKHSPDTETDHQTGDDLLVELVRHMSTSAVYWKQRKAIERFLEAYEAMAKWYS